MNTDKVKKIQSIKSEVKEFHPILNQLLQRLPNIKNVEYTHGPNEMGADFVLSKLDPTLSRIEYVGVIVKVGNISQGHADVDAQIEECELERKIEGGKKKIFVSEIWVITNGNISNNAQDKIHHKYKNKKINLISGENLSVLFDKYYSEYWTDVSVEIGEYLRSVKSKSESLAKTIDILDTTIYGDSYIPQVLINVSDEIYNDPGRYKAPKKLRIENILDDEKFIFIEGTMGTGKSRIIEKITQDYSSTEFFNTKKTVPYVDTFKNFISEYDGDIEKIVEIVDSNISIDSVKYLIMLDAVDEVKTDESTILTAIENIYMALRSRDDCIVLLTSRPFDSVVVEADIDKYFKRFRILPLSPKQILNIVDGICDRFEIKNNLISELENSSLFKVLPKTPMSAVILGKLLSQDIQEVPSTMTELYSKYTEIALGRWDIDKGLQSQTEYDVSCNVTMNIAKYFLDNELDKISIREARDMFDEYVSSRKLKINSNSVFNKLMSNFEIFKLNDSDMTIAFVHRTFAEYFYACHMDRDNNALIDEDIYSIYWNNCYFFYFGIKKDCPDLLNAVETINFKSEEAKVSQMFTTGDLLLAAYLTPYEVIDKLLVKSFNDASVFLNDIMNGKTSSPLNVLPKMHLLSIFTHSMSEAYGYGFFFEALENRSLDISCTTNLSEVEYMELFLINSVLVSMKKLKAFDVMVNSYGKYIPMELQVGIIHSVKENKCVSPIVKKYIKQHMKKVHKNKSLHESIIELYEKPINKQAALELNKHLAKQLN
ncbi:MAG: hypothetical protein RPU60_02795 [Candidatus Sedimenticola sp. (ex Thyasira tokunagai)]